MVDESVVSDIRRLLKTFGVKADEAIIQHLAAHPNVNALYLRVHLEDLTEYSDSTVKPLELSVEGGIQRQEQ